MNPMIDKTLRLILICGIAALALGMINSLTEPVIKERKEREVLEALSSLVFQGEIGSAEMVDHPVVSQYYPVVEEGENVAYILDVIGQGYAGDMRILCSYKSNGEIIRVKLMENEETPGLGKEAESDEYMVKFIGTGGDSIIPLTKDQVNQERDDITGATITFSAIAQAISSGSDFIKGME